MVYAVLLAFAFEAYGELTLLSQFDFKPEGLDVNLKEGKVGQNSLARVHHGGHKHIDKLWKASPIFGSIS
jgi:hypothetical protein